MNKERIKELKGKFQNCSITDIEAIELGKLCGLNPYYLRGEVTLSPQTVNSINNKLNSLIEYEDKMTGNKLKQFKVYTKSIFDGLESILFIGRTKNKTEMRSYILNHYRLKEITKVVYGKRTYTISDIYAGR